MNVDFRPLTQSDWHIVADIFNQGIETQNATFETQIPSWKQWDSTHVKCCRIVATVKNIVVGWAALIPVSAGKFIPVLVR